MLILPRFNNIIALIFLIRNIYELWNWFQKHLFRSQNFEDLQILPLSETPQDIRAQAKGMKHHKAGDKKKKKNHILTWYVILELWQTEWYTLLNHLCVAKWAMQINKIAINTHAILLQMITSLEMMLEKTAAQQSTFWRQLEVPLWRDVLDAAMRSSTKSQAPGRSDILLLCPQVP